MKKLNLVFAILIALVTITSCNKDDKLTPAEILVQYSPWDYVGLELLNIVNTGNTDFVKEEWEDAANTDIGNLIFDFMADGTMIITRKDPPNPDKVEYWNWEIINGNQIKFYESEGSDEEIYDNLKVTETDFEFTFKDFDLDENVTADLVYFFE